MMRRAGRSSWQDLGFPPRQHAERWTEITTPVKPSLEDLTGDESFVIWD